MFKREATSTNYAIEIPNVDKFLAIDKYELEQDASDCLYLSLETIGGVNNIDYNGHFGSYIYLRLDITDDTPETWEAINKMIADQIEVANEFIRESKQREEQ